MSKHYSQHIEEITVQPLEQVDTVLVALMIDARIRIQGDSGKVYVFNGAGSTANVDKNDVETLLQKRQGGRQCCGGTGNGNQVFEIVGE